MLGRKEFSGKNVLASFKWTCGGVDPKGSEK